MVTSAAIGFAGLGVYATISNTIELRYVKESLEAVKATVITRVEFSSLSADVGRIARSIEDGTRSRYTSDQAALDRKVVSDQILQHAQDIRKANDDLRELMIFKAKVEERSK